MTGGVGGDSFVIRLKVAIQLDESDCKCCELPLFVRYLKR